MTSIEIHESKKFTISYDRTGITKSKISGGISIGHSDKTYMEGKKIIYPYEVKIYFNDQEYCDNLWVEKIRPANMNSLAKISVDMTNKHTYKIYIHQSENNIVELTNVSAIWLENAHRIISIKPSQILIFSKHGKVIQLSHDEFDMSNYSKNT